MAFRSALTRWRKPSGRPTGAQRTRPAVYHCFACPCQNGLGAFPAQPAVGGPPCRCSDAVGWRFGHCAPLVRRELYTVDSTMQVEDWANPIGSVSMHSIDRFGSPSRWVPDTYGTPIPARLGPARQCRGRTGALANRHESSIRGQATFRVADVTITDLRFVAPYQGLPDSSRLGHVRLMRPDSPGRVVLLMAAFNDHGYATRQSIAKYLLRRNIAVAILENPFYGLRRPREGQPLQTAYDLLAMGIGAVHDGLEVLAMLRSRGTWQVGVAGYSMGANTAALVAAVSEGPVACAALAASHSPGPVFTEGALRASVDWDALGGLGAVDDLAKVFGTSHRLRFEPQAHLSKAVVMGIEGDGYVPRFRDHRIGRSLARGRAALDQRRPRDSSLDQKANPGRPHRTIV